jgi:hypothetical protein
MFVTVSHYHICLIFACKAIEAGLLNKGSCLAQALGVTKFVKIREMIWVTLCCAS